MGRTASKTGCTAGDFNLGKLCADMPTLALLSVKGLLTVSQPYEPLVEKFPPPGNGSRCWVLQNVKFTSNSAKNACMNGTLNDRQPTFKQLVIGFKSVGRKKLTSGHVAAKHRQQFGCGNMTLAN
jgi:hypothetical protein